MHAVATKVAEAEAVAAAAIARAQQAAKSQQSAATISSPSSVTTNKENDQGASSNHSVPGLVKAVSKRLSIFGAPKHDNEKEKEKEKERSASVIAAPIISGPASAPALVSDSNSKSAIASAPTTPTKQPAVQPPMPPQQQAIPDIHSQKPFSNPTPVENSRNPSVYNSPAPSSIASSPMSSPQPMQTPDKNARASVSPTQKPAVLPPSAHPILSANLSPAQTTLLAHIGEGITIVKHGMLLFCFMLF